MNTSNEPESYLNAEEARRLTLKGRSMEPMKKAARAYATTAAAGKGITHKYDGCETCLTVAAFRKVAFEHGWQEAMEYMATQTQLAHAKECDEETK